MAPSKGTKKEHKAPATTSTATGGGGGGKTKPTATTGGKKPFKPLNKRKFKNEQERDEDKGPANKVSHHPQSTPTHNGHLTTP